MTFPAEQNFKRDKSLTPTQRRVYDYLTTTLDFWERRTVKTGVECEMIGTDKESFRLALNVLVAKGYLIEHARDAYNVRTFTLAWSLASCKNIPPSSPAA